MRWTVIFSVILLASCSSHRVDRELEKVSIESSDSIYWSSTYVPVTRCESSQVDRFEFTVFSNGLWTADVKISEDTKLGHNRLLVGLYFQGQQMHDTRAIKLMQETIKASSSITYNLEGKLEYLKKNYPLLSDADIVLIHDCGEQIKLSAQ